LGQSGFLIKTDDGILVIDPYLSEHLTRKYEGTSRPHVRMTRAPLRGADLETVDLALASHKHSDHLDPETLTGLLYLGYVIETEGFRLYHSGDSLAYDGLAVELGQKPFDMLFLPINGRDPARGVPGNMTAAEAVDLAALVRPRYLVPLHYDMFTFNTVAVEVFEAEARRLPVGVEPRILQCGERWEIKK